MLASGFAYPWIENLLVCLVLFVIVLIECDVHQLLFPIPIIHQPYSHIISSQLNTSWTYQ